MHGTYEFLKDTITMLALFISTEHVFMVITVNTLPIGSKLVSTLFVQLIEYVLNATGDTKSLLHAWLWILVMGFLA